MPTYEKANADVLDRVERMMQKFHPELKEFGVTLDLLFARPNVDDDGIAKGDAIKVGGYRALACIKVISAKDRVAGRSDAEMLIDYDNWQDADEAERDALMDHELEHLELKRDKETNLPVYDDAGRPMLKLRKHDHQFGWFDSVARRHGEASGEKRQARIFVENTYSQLWLKGFTGDEGVSQVTLSTSKKSVTLTAGEFARKVKKEFGKG